jgi:hypothetical protein
MRPAAAMTTERRETLGIETLGIETLGMVFSQMSRATE